MGNFTVRKNIICTHFDKKKIGKVKVTPVWMLFFLLSIVLVSLLVRLFKDLIKCVSDANMQMHTITYCNLMYFHEENCIVILKYRNNLVIIVLKNKILVC